MNTKRRSLKGISSKRVATIGFLALIIFVGIAWWLTVSDKKGAVKLASEDTNLKVVQFYLHLPDRDVIIGRSNPGFEKLVNLAGKVLSSIEQPQQLVFEGKDIQETVRDLEKNTTSLSVWLIAPQTIKVKTTSGNENNSSANKMEIKKVETDRILFILGGKYQGTVLIKKPLSDEHWSSWKVSGDGLKKLTEVIRSGEL